MMHEPSSSEHRRRADRRHHGRRLGDQSARNTDADRLLHELQVHQVELEMQNEELRQARNQLETALQRYTDLYDRAPVGYFTLDDFGVIVRLNLAAARLLGSERERLVGRPFPLFLAPGDRSAFSAFLTGTLNRGGQAGCEVALVPTAGPSRHLQIEAAPDKDGQSFGIVAVDVTDKKRAHEELVRSNLELKQYAYVAAHDLQTPLRSIIGFAQLLRSEFQDRLGPRANAWIEQMAYHVHRMQSLVRDLLEHSSVESRGRPFEPTDLNRVADEVIASAEPAIREAAAVVTRDTLPTVQADRLQLAQVMQNLIDNAVKYRGEAPPRVHISAEREAGAWRIAVRDNGIGIAEKHHRDIFEIFRRLHSQHSYPGTGIGLAICQRVIERHGGRIWVESAPGAGSTFFFTLPDRPGQH